MKTLAPPKTSYEVDLIRLEIRRDGVLAGTPMVRVQLAPWRRESERTKAGDAGLIAAAARNAAGPNVDWAFITGPEPADHDLDDLADALRDEGFSLAIETSGISTGHLNAGCDWVCIVLGHAIRVQGGHGPSVYADADEFKLVIASDEDVDLYDRMLADLRKVEVLPDCITVQPANPTAMCVARCVKLAKERGWRLNMPLVGI